MTETSGAPAPTNSLGLDLEVMLLPDPFASCVHVLARDLRQPDAEAELEARADAAPDSPTPRPTARPGPLTNAEIAAARHVGEATVKTHVGSIFVKPGVRDRVAAIVHAFDDAWSPRGAEGVPPGSDSGQVGTSGVGLRLRGVPPGAYSD